MLRLFCLELSILFITIALYFLIVFFFFFQAEDGIRDLIVTGVQTCALPISNEGPLPGRRLRSAPAAERPQELEQHGVADVGVHTETEATEEHHDGHDHQPTKAAGAARPTSS